MGHLKWAMIVLEFWEYFIFLHFFVFFLCGILPDVLINYWSLCLTCS